MEVEPLYVVQAAHRKNGRSIALVELQDKKKKNIESTSKLEPHEMKYIKHYLLYFQILSPFNYLDT
jgi:hypothetical protein